eukprot:1136949-Pelagomonas_calceolata.AAC.11
MSLREQNMAAPEDNTGAAPGWLLPDGASPLAMSLHACSLNCIHACMDGLHSSDGCCYPSLQRLHHESDFQAGFAKAAVCHCCNHPHATHTKSSTFEL